MNLKELRTQFVQKSGRYDLVDDNFLDNGADFFIQAGQRLLDKRGDFGTGQVGEWKTTLNKNSDTFIVERCWSITSIYLIGIKNSSWEKLTFTYSFDTPKCRLSGEQLYTLVPIRSYPKLKDAKANDINLSASSFAVSANYSFDEVEGLQVKLLPKISQDSIVRVVGNFYSEPLLHDTDSNYWSVLYPDTLLKAAMYELEVFYRNSEGAKDWLAAITVDIQNIEETELFASIQGEQIMGE